MSRIIARTESTVSLDDCEMHGYFGDQMKCCPSLASLAPSDSGVEDVDCHNLSFSTGSDAAFSSTSSCTSLRSLDDVIVEEDGETCDGTPIMDVPDGGPRSSPKNLRAPIGILIMVQIQWFIVVSFAWMRACLLRLGFEKHDQAQERPEQLSFTPLYELWEPLFTLYIIRRLRDILNRPLAGTPGSQMLLKDRVSYDHAWTFQLTGTNTRVINLGSYNYLGFAQNDGLCARTAQTTIDAHGIGVGSSMHEFGNTTLHRELEKKTAEFLGTEDAICYPMGFGTNTMGLPAIVDKRCLVLSDELNHASLILGCRLSGATTKVFKHNNPKDCERRLLDALSHGHPMTGLPYSKILIVIEGLYSMEGNVPELPDFVALKKKYRAYLFMDEAHSIGSMGRTGRGVSEYWRLPATDVDILMGTFTKGMSAAGGYMAGTSAVIRSIRAHSHGCYAPTMSPPVVQQVVTALNILSGLDGTRDGIRRLAQLRINTRYFRRRLREAGFMVIGNEDSPVVPVLFYGTCKVAEFARQMLALNIGVVVVGFPATPIATERARFCLSSGHTREQLDYAIECITMVGDQINIRFMPPTPMIPLELVRYETNARKVRKSRNIKERQKWKRAIQSDIAETID